jgi:hypothetical protein
MEISPSKLLFDHYIFDNNIDICVFLTNEYIKDNIFEDTDQNFYNKFRVLKK